MEEADGSRHLQNQTQQGESHHSGEGPIMSALPYCKTLLANVKNHHELKALRDMNQVWAEPLCIGMTSHKADVG